MVPTILAYLDPGSGSLLLQLMLGGMAAVGVTLKLYWHRLRRLLRIRKDDENQTGAGSPPADATLPHASEDSTRVTAGKETS